MSEQKVIDGEQSRRLSMTEMIGETLLLMNKIMTEHGNFKISFGCYDSSYTLSTSEVPEDKVRYLFYRRSPIRSANRSGLPGALFKVDENQEIYGGKQNMDRVFDFCVSGGYLEDLSRAVTHKGFQRIDQLAKTIDSKQAFVAMNFDSSYKEIREAIKAAIEDRGYTARIIDEKRHNQNIYMEIVEEIRRSKFTVAEFTGQKAGVYWEAGFMKGLGREVIHCVSEKEAEKMHFDLSQTNQIRWKDEADLKEQLIKHIKATVV
jgi:nucleoside 2-deoxyribosyltransferase